MGRLYAVPGSTASGNEVTQAEFLGAGTTEVTQPSTYTVDAAVYEDMPIKGSTKKFHVLKYRVGQVISQADVDNTFIEMTVGTVSPATGLTTGVTDVTIPGTNFLSANVSGVTFGGTAATNVVVVSDTEITCHAPAHATGLVNVVVQADAGDITKTGAFTYEYPPAGTVATITPNSGSTAGGTDVVLAGTNLLGATGVTFGGTAATAVVVTDTSIACKTPAKTAGAVTVVVLLPQGNVTKTTFYTYS